MAKSDVSPRRYRSLALLLWAIFLVFSVVGCGGEDENAPPSEADLIFQRVSEISDAGNNPDKLKALFAADSVPDRAWLKEAMKYTLQVVDVKVDGETATATVELEENMSGEITGSHEWACEKVDGEWKIKTSAIK